METNKTLEIIRSEIERLIVKHELEYTTAGYVMNELLSFLSTLESEKPMNQKGLEREIERCLWKLSDDPSNEELRMFARHFAKWGAEHLANSNDEIVINGHMVAYNKNKDAITMEEIPNELEEAAVDIADALLDKPKDYVLSAKADYWNGAHDGIIAGAKWQAEHSPFPEDTVLFNKGVAEGKRLMMMDAVDAIVEDWNPDPEPEITIPLNPEEFTRGDKVRIIIIKDDGKSD